MILRKMRLRNFRQFRGEQEIVFSLGEGGNVTVVFGENGRGKTGLYRALLFCLYGDCCLPQDEEVSSRDLHLVNYPEIEHQSADGKPARAIVLLEFEHAGVKYSLQRTILGMLDKKGEVVEQHDGVKLASIQESGNSETIDDPRHISEVVGSILDRGIREYFLFDGEKIERLTRAGTQQRKEVSRGVRKLLDIDTLETAIDATAHLRKLSGDTIN